MADSAEDFCSPTTKEFRFIGSTAEQESLLVRILELDARRTDSTDYGLYTWPSAVLLAELVWVGTMRGDVLFFGFRAALFV